MLNNLVLKILLILTIMSCHFACANTNDNNPEKTISVRQLAMKGMWLRIKRIAPYVESTNVIEYGPSDAERDVIELVQLLDKVEHLWPKTTNLANSGMTKANPSVWAVPDYFKKLYNRAQKSAVTLQQSIIDKNDEEARLAICELGKSCGSCHASFRRLLTSQLASEAGDWSGKYVSECDN